MASVPATRRVVAHNRLASLPCSAHTLHAVGVRSSSIHGRIRGTPTIANSVANTTRRMAAALLHRKRGSRRPAWRYLDGFIAAAWPGFRWLVSPRPIRAAAVRYPSLEWVGYAEPVAAAAIDHA